MQWVSKIQCASLDVSKSSAICHLQKFCLIRGPTRLKKDKSECCGAVTLKVDAEALWQDAIHTTLKCNLLYWCDLFFAELRSFLCLLPSGIFKEFFALQFNQQGCILHSGTFASVGRDNFAFVLQFSLRDTCFKQQKASSLVRCNRGVECESLAGFDAKSFKEYAWL